MSTMRKQTADSRWQLFIQRSRKMNWIHCLALVAVLILFGFKPPQTIVSEEHKVKAVFLYNFAQFVDWPAADFAGPDSAIVIGVLGKDPFGTFLEETVKDELVKGHPIAIQRFNSVREIKQCHILFVNVTGTRLGNTLAALKGKNILTVGDAGNFTKVGGMIRFKNQDNKIRLQINLNQVKQTDIVISSKLLRLSEIVE